MDFAFELVNGSQIGILQIFERDDLSPYLSQSTERLNKILDLLVHPACGGRKDLSGLLGDPLGLLFRVPPDSNNLVKFINRRRSGRMNQSQRFPKGESGFLLEPEISVDDIARFPNQVNVKIGVGIFLTEQAQNFVALGHGSHHIPIADFKEVRTLICVGLKILANKRGLPNLQGMKFLRRFITPEKNQLTILEE